MATVTKRELVERIAARTKMTRTAVKKVLQTFLDEIVNELGQGNRLEFRDFGVFEVKTRAARRAQNPKTLERVDVPSKLAVKFKPGRRMKELLDQQALELDQRASQQIASQQIEDKPAEGSLPPEKPRSSGFVEDKPAPKAPTSAGDPPASGASTEQGDA